MFSDLANLSPGNVAYLCLVLAGFFAITLTLAIIPPWSDRGRVKSGRPVKVTKAVRPEAKATEYKTAA